MKKSILYILLLAGSFWSCENKDESVFDESTDTRLNALLSSYQTQLTESANGWNAVMYTNGGGSYAFYMKFDDKNRVTMYSDFTEASASTAKESSYRLKAVQTPVLIFDTYGYLHVLADPDDRINGGVRGEGLKSDFEFTIFPDSVTAEKITFVGRKNQSRLVLTKATQAQSASYASGDLADALAFKNFAKYQNYFKRITIGAINYEINVNELNRIIKLTWLEGTTVKSFSTEFYYNPGGLSFATPLINGSQTIAGFENITWDADKGVLAMSVNGAKVTIVGALKPVSVDLAAPKRWWQVPVEVGGYWISYDGFHINGVDDALKVNSLMSGTSPYEYYFYWPKYETTYDAFGPAFVTDNSLALYYADAPRTPTFTTDGRVIFSSGGVLGTFPETGPAVDSRNVLYEKGGFYLIQTSVSTYDMVSATDSKIWISWQP